MKVLLVGGSGLIGQALACRLLENGDQVWILTRSQQGKNEPRCSQGSVAWVTWDGKTPQGWGPLAGEMDAIINLAGANIGDRPWTEERRQVLRASRVNAGKAIVAAIEQNACKPSVVIQISGVNYYSSRGDQPVDEQGQPGKDFLASVAVDWENGTKPVTEVGIRHVIMRTGVVLSRKGGVLAPFLLQQRLFAGGPLGSGKQWISWIQIQDLMDCFLFFLNNNQAEGIFNVCSPEPVTNAEFGKTLAKVIHRPYWLPAPAFMLRLVLGEMSTLVLDGVRVIPKRLLETGFLFQYASLRRALEDLLK